MVVSICGMIRTHSNGRSPFLLLEFNWTRYRQMRFHFSRNIGAREGNTWRRHALNMMAQWRTSLAPCMLTHPVTALILPAQRYQMSD